MSLPDVSVELQQQARALVAACPQPCGALHPLLELLRGADDVPPARVDQFVAELTGLSVAAVHAIGQSRAAGHGDGVIALCTGLSCQWMGAAAARQQLASVANLAVVEVDCLGACSAAPVMKRGGRLYDGLTAERLNALVAGDR